MFKSQHINKFSSYHQEKEKMSQENKYISKQLSAQFRLLKVAAG